METIQENIVKFKFSVKNFTRNFIENNDEICSRSVVNYNIDGGISSWKLVLYPNGRKNEDSGHLGVFLELVKTDGVKFFEVEVKTWIEGSDNDEISWKRDIMNYNSVSATAWGWGQFISHRNLFLNQDVMLPFDTLTVACEFSILSSPGNVHHSEGKLIGNLMEKITELEDTCEFYEHKYKKGKLFHRNHMTFCAEEIDQKIGEMKKVNRELRKDLERETLEKLRLLLRVEKLLKENITQKREFGKLENHVKELECEKEELHGKYEATVKELHTKKDLLKELEDECPLYQHMLERQ